jgi:hypothetical protein
VLVSHASSSPDTHPASFWQQFVELGVSHADVFEYILGKLPNKPEWVKLLRQVDSATRHVVSQAVDCIRHNPNNPPLQFPLEEVFPAAYQLHTGSCSDGPASVGLSLDSLALTSPQLLCKLQRVALVCAARSSWGRPVSSMEALSADSLDLSMESLELDEPLEPEELHELEEPLTASLGSFLSRCATIACCATSCMPKPCGAGWPVPQLKCCLMCTGRGISNTCGGKPGQLK